nr:hypothetical protein [uncultured Sphaerochaeta sp.]
MKKFLLVLLLCISVMFPVIADDAFSSQYRSASLLAQGGVRGPLATGVEALFTNPAGIVRENELMFPNINGSLYINYSPLTIPILQDMLTGGGDYSYDPQPESSYSSYDEAYNDGYQDAQNSQEGFLGIISPEKIGPILRAADYKNGVGGNVGVNVGVAYAGAAVGGYFSSDMLFEKSSTSANVDFTYVSETALSAGLSYKLGMGGSALYVGASANKIWQVISKKTIAEDDVEKYVDGTYEMGDTPAILGEGIGFNAGAILKTGPLMVSVAVNNILGTALATSSGTLDEALSIGFFGSQDADSFEQYFIPPLTGDSTGKLTIPMSMDVGVGIQQGLGKIFNVQLAAEYTHIFKFTETENALNNTIWKNVHVGGAVDLFDTVSVRAGLNQGYFTTGFGVKFIEFFNLIDIEFNATYYARELGSFAGHRQGEAMICDITFTI